jgi:hypothetical protein
VDSGALYVFTRSGTTWSQQAYVKASNTGSGDWFGSHVAVSGSDGNTLAVAARFEDSNATGVGGSQTDNSAADSGAVYVLTRAGTAWSQQAYVKASNTGAGDELGTYVALSDDGNVLAVGAEHEDGGSSLVNGNQSDNSKGNAGAAYRFMRFGSTWSQDRYLKASNPNGWETTTGDKFGRSLAITPDGNILAVAGSKEDSNATGIDGDQNDNSMDMAGAMYLIE